MRAIEIIDGGMLTTVQDRGRYGYQRYGVPTSGAMDTRSLRAANRLVGNDDGDACLEMTFMGPRLLFLAPALVALTGADLDATLDGRPAPLYEPFRVEEGATLAFGGATSGVRAYLAVAGGIDVPLVLGSRSTYLRSRLGGFEGRALAAGDVLHVAGRAGGLAVRRRGVPPGELPLLGHDHVLRVILGPQDDRFTLDGLATFLSATYRVTPQSDRMGYRLEGPKIAHVAGADIVSDGSPLGAVQVAGDGTPIVLMADRGTAGGYTKIATVVSVDVARLAQAAPGDTVRFQSVTLAKAYDALRGQEDWLDRIAPARGTPGARADLLKKVAAAAAAIHDRLT